MRSRRPKRPRFLAFAAAPPGGVSAAVFELPGAGLRAHPWMGAGVSAMLMVSLALWAAARPHHRPVEREPRPQMVVELFKAPPPPAPPPPAARPHVSAPQAAAPAQAAHVVAKAAPADEALDLTSFTIATGNGPQYAGGKTASSGTSTHAVTGAVAHDGVADGTGDLSRAVHLSEREWDCPWPTDADALGIDRQIVVLRVTVRADGSVESAAISQDPGNGFGAAALACARRSRFEPARDAAGTAIYARSPPIRVLFTR